MSKKKVVVSGVNMVEGGIRTILQDCARAAVQHIKTNDTEFIFLVHSKELLAGMDEGLTVYEYPEIKSSWSKRIRFEYTDSKKLSAGLKPDVWLALHDMTPNVTAPLQYVYCHNPSPFFRSRLSDALIDHKLFLFSLFYKYLYAINIKRNRYVITQQNWMRKAFKKFYGVPCIVAHPAVQLDTQPANDAAASITRYDKYTFFYPSYPRIFKNFETLFDAVVKLSATRNDFQVLITFDEHKNKLAKKLFDQYSANPNIKFIGEQKRDAVYEIFKKADCLVFPSKLETWGLPLTEGVLFKKPILSADLEYAHETIGNYQNVKFFDADNSDLLATYMGEMIDGSLKFDGNTTVEPEQPFFSNWDDLLNFLLNPS